VISTFFANHFSLAENEVGSTFFLSVLNWWVTWVMGHKMWPIVSFDMGYFCDNFSLPRPLCSRLRHDVRDRQTDRRQTSDDRQTSDAHHCL